MQSFSGLGRVSPFEHETVILLMRTWALWDRNKHISLGLLILGASAFAASSFTLNQWLLSLTCEL
jgi:hypothetical protein